MALDPDSRISRRDQPSAVPGLAERRGKAGGGIETRQTQPIDRAVAADQRGRGAIADQGIVFDPLVRWHPVVACCSAASICPGGGKLESMAPHSGWGCMAGCNLFRVRVGRTAAEGQRALILSHRALFLARPGWGGSLER